MYILIPAYLLICKVKVKVSRYRPEQVLGDPEGSGYRIFSTFGSMKMVRSSTLRTGRLYLQEFLWYSILEAESTPGHMVPSVTSEKNPQRHHRGSIPRSSD
jgi:hypothetical protein